MYHVFGKLLIVCCLLRVIDGGVKIEITRIKEQPKAISLAQNAESDQMTPISVEPDETTPVLASPSTETTTFTSTITTTTTTETTTTKLAIESNIQRLMNATISSTVNATEVTTIHPSNVTEQMKPANTTITSMIPVNNVTLIHPKDLNPYLSEFTRRQMRRKHIPRDYYCPCDLKINFCDINCCCDVDCASQEILQTLKCTEQDWSIYDYEESSELQLCSQTRQFSLFCVVDSARMRKKSRKRDFMVHKVNVMDVVQYKWPNQFDQKSTSQYDYREHYTYGDSLLVWDDANEEFQSLDIPWSFGASNCGIKMAIKHLVDDEIKCVQTLDEHDQFIGNFQSKLKTVKILKYRKPINTPSIIMADFCRSSQMFNETENCTMAEIYHCIDIISMRTCQLDINSTGTSVPEFGDNFHTDELSIQIHHNFTNILNVTVFFVYHEFNDDNPMAHIVQKISMEYLELNETFATRDVHQVSGNIGYLMHRPVIVSQLLRQNASTIEKNVESRTVLAYFHNETNCTNDDHYLKMPHSQPNGDCVINNSTFQTINFGERSRIKCNAVLLSTDSNDTDSVAHATLNFEKNNTHICRAFQKQIFNYLLYEFELENANATIYNRFNIRISEMGNPKNDSQHWIDMRTIRPPNFDEIVAIGGTNSATEFTCTNMILTVRYEFFYGTMLVGQISNQALIKLAQLQFGNRLNLQFKLDDDVLKVPVYIDVMFYDFSLIVDNGSSTLIQFRHTLLLTLLISIWLICAKFRQHSIDF